jgi:hypothetical protein
MSLISVVDSYYSWIVHQLGVLGAKITVNGNLIDQPVCGIVNARDWPQTRPVEGGLYLLVLNQVPGGGTISQRQYQYFCQWSWMLIGQDIQQDQLVQNRADRYRQCMQVEENLRQANYPGFTGQQNVTSDIQGNLTFTPSLTPPNIFESIRWSELRFMPKDDNKQSGLLFGAAAVEVYAFSAVNPLVA